jgi:hypothetical protein
MPVPTTYRIIYEPKHRNWALKRPGPGTPASYPTKEQAMIAGQRAARQDEPCRLVVHRKDGEVEFDWIYGASPYQPKPGALLDRTPVPQLAEPAMDW